MSEQVVIRSVKHYFKEFIQSNADVMNRPIDRARIKMQLLDAFRKEIFGQIAFQEDAQTVITDLDKLVELESVRNILHNSVRKWRRLCILCNDAGLKNWLTLDDLKENLLEVEKEHEDGHMMLSDKGADKNDSSEDTSEGVRNL